MLIEFASDDAELINFMQQIGWFPDRRADLRLDLEAWVAHEYEAPDAVREFMTECSGIEFEYPRHPAVGGMYSCVVSGALSSRRVARTLVAEHELQLGGSLTPIGESASGNLLLVMDSSGITYGVHDRFRVEIAGDGYRALLAIWKKAVSAHP